MQNQGFDSIRLSTGGLIFRFYNLLHIQEPQSYSITRRIVVIITLSWLPLFLLTGIEGNLFNSNLDLPFLFDLQPYVKYLGILPFLIVAGKFIDPLIASVIHSMRSSGILGENNKGQYEEAIERLAIRKDSYIADIVIIFISYTIVLSFQANLERFDASLEYTNWITSHSATGVHLTLAGWWFVLVSSPVLQIVFFRWFWRFYLWGTFLFQVSRIKLDLQPTHPDLAGGLGILKNGENAFILIFIAMAMNLSISLSVDIQCTDMNLVQALPIVLSYIIASLVLMTIPLFVFSRQLGYARRWGRVVYGDLGYRLSHAFNEKWGNSRNLSDGDELLKTDDSSVVCDYGDIYNTVRDMRFIPISLEGLVMQTVTLILPFLPLLLTEFSLPDILRRVVESLI